MSQTHNRETVLLFSIKHTFYTFVSRKQRDSIAPYVYRSSYHALAEPETRCSLPRDFACVGQNALEQAQRNITSSTRD
jgi:hypothetical protein